MEDRNGELNEEPLTYAEEDESKIIRHQEKMT